MNLSKSTLQGVGALVVLGVLAAAGFFVVKPQVGEAFELQTKTANAQQAAELRQLRLNQLNKTAKDGGKVLGKTIESLVSIPERRDATEIERSVVAALDGNSSKLASFQYGTMDPTQPAYKAPTLSLKPLEAATVSDPADELAGGDAAAGAATTTESEASQPASGTEAPAAPAGESSVPESASGSPEDAINSTTGTTAPAIDPNPLGTELEAVPFTITIEDLSSSDTFAFLDKLQNQARLIHVVSVTSGASSSEDDGGDTGASTLTIYAYAFAGSDTNVKQFTENVTKAASNQDK